MDSPQRQHDAVLAKGTLGEETRAVRQDWEHKRADPSIPGANPSEGGAEDADSD